MDALDRLWIAGCHCAIIRQVFQIPEVRYVRRPRRAVAYQVWGSGEVDMLLLTEFSTSVDNIWEHPARVRMLVEEGTLARVIRFDPRGTGASDPLPYELLGSLEPWLEDALAVLDAEQVSGVIVWAEGFMCQLGVALAAEHPDRVLRLILIDGFAAGPGSAGSEQGNGQDFRSALAASVAASWGTGEITGRSSPSLTFGAPDPRFLGHTERLGASPGVAATIVDALIHSDVRALLPRLRVPTLIVHTGTLTYVQREDTRALASSIRGARMLEVTFPESSWYWGDPSFDEVWRFAVGRIPGDVRRILSAVMFTDVVESTRVAARVGDAEWSRRVEHLDAFVSTHVRRYAGRLVKQLGDGHLIVFPSPQDAVHAALGIRRSAETFDLKMRFGIHFGEVEERPDGDVVGIAIHVASRVASLAGPQEVLASQTLADLVAGSGFTLADRGRHELKGLPGLWQIFALTE